MDKQHCDKWSYIRNSINITQTSPIIFLFVRAKLIRNRHKVRKELYAKENLEISRAMRSLGERAQGQEKGRVNPLLLANGSVNLLREFLCARHETPQTLTATFIFRHFSGFFGPLMFFFLEKF